MAELAHANAEVTTAVTHTGDTTWTDIAGASIASGSFTTGERYLIVVTAMGSLSGASSREGIRLLHGSTEFARSRHIRSLQAADTWYPYCFITVWTAVSGEGIKLQQQTSSSSLTVSTDQIRMDVINLDEDLTENTDWWFNENATSTSLTTSWSTSNNAAVTFTPAAADDFLVIVTQHFDMNTAVGGFATLGQSRINRSGEASDVTKEAFHRQRQNIEENPLVIPWVFSLTGVSNTFTAQMKINSSGDTPAPLRTYSSVFVIRKAVFTDFVYAQGAGPTVLSTSAYGTEVESVGITPTNAGDVFVLASAFFGHDNNNNHTQQWRLQVDEADQPPTQTADAHVTQYFSLASTGREPILISTLENLSAALHTHDLDASASAGTCDVYNFQIVSFTMDSPLAGEPAAVPTLRTVHSNLRW
jgi:hypothetical protein